MDQENNDTEEYRKYLKTLEEGKPYVVPDIDPNSKEYRRKAEEYRQYVKKALEDGDDYITPKELWIRGVIVVTIPRPTDTFRNAVIKLPHIGSKAYNELVNSNRNSRAMVHPKGKKRDSRLWEILTPRLFSLPPNWAYKRYGTRYDDPEIDSDTISDPRGDAKQDGYLRAYEIVLPVLIQLHTVPDDQLPNDFEIARLMYRAASTGLASANKAIEREQSKDEALDSLDKVIEEKGMLVSPHELIPSDMIDGETEMLREDDIRELFEGYKKANPNQVELLDEIQEIILRYPEQYTFSFLIEYLSARLMLKPDTTRKRIRRLIPPD